MAYFSGNALYIRLTKRQTNMDELCGGVLITLNTFTNNIGMKTHNGGAISIYCHILTTQIHNDYYAVSSLNFRFGDDLQSTINIQDEIKTNIRYKVYPYMVKIDSNNFVENYSGQKGTALYLRQINYIWIKNCSFTENGPVFSAIEEQHSPYFKHFSNRSITYFSEVESCPSEFSFMASCGSSKTIIDWYGVKGAVYLEHCQDQECLRKDNIMTSLIESNTFSNNQAGPILDPQFSNDYASQLYLAGGFQNIIKSTQFTDNSGPETSLIYINNGILRFIDNRIENNGHITSDVMENNPSMHGLDQQVFSSYQITLAQNYGILRIKGTSRFKSESHYFADNIFMYTFAERGSVFHLNLEGQYALFEKNIYKYNLATHDGSLMYAFGQDTQSMIIMRNENIEYQFSNNGTIVAGSNNRNTMSILISDSSLTNFYATESPAFNFFKLQKVVLSNVQISQSLNSINLKEEIKKNFDTYSNELYDFIDTEALNTLTTNSTSKKAQISFSSVGASGNIYFGDRLYQNAKDQFNTFVEIVNCNFSNLYADSSSVLYISNTKVLHKNNNSANNGIFNSHHLKNGAITVENSGSYYGQNLLIYKSISSSFASVIYADLLSNVTFENTTFVNNRAESQGLAFIQGSSFLNCNNCKFYKNYANDASILFADNNPNGFIQIQNSQFLNNTSKSNMFNMLYTNSLIKNSEFIDNVAQIVSHGITITSSSLEIQNVTVNYSDRDFLSQNDTNVESGFFNVNFQSKLKISKSLFQNTRGKIAGTVYASGSSSVTIESHTIFKNSISISGSVLYFSSTQSAMITNSYFQSNSLTDIFVQNANLVLNGNQFVGNQQNLHGEEGILLIQNNIFKDGENYDSPGKAIYCSCENFILKNNTFMNLSGSQGGALYLTSNSRKSFFSIETNVFRNMSAQQGGAIYIQDAPTMQILSNKFEENKATYGKLSSQLVSSSSDNNGLGGAIFSTCINNKIGLNKDCNITIGKSNEFIGNQADFGGGIIWISNRFNDDGTNKFIDNKAKYGKDVASYPKSMKVQFITNNDYFNPVNNMDAQPSMRRLYSNYEPSKLDEQMTQIVPGTPFEFKIYIFDQDNILYNADNTSTAILSSLSSNVLLKNNEAIAKEGVFHFDQVTIYTQPGTSVKLSLNIQGMNTYNNDIDFLLNNVKMDVILRNCTMGEAMTTQLSCQPCPANQYLYLAPQTVTPCLPCNESAICYGLNKTAPLPGYWRNHSTSETWLSCPRNESCLGGNETYPNGICDVGYTGITCADCEDNYSKIGPFECSECPNKKRNTIQISLIVIAQLLYTAYLTRSTMNGALQEEPVHSVYLKIMTNHFQIIGVISNIPFNWPEEINQFQAPQTKAAKSSDQIYSYDCFLADNGFDVRVYYQKLMVFGLMPIVLCLILAVFWLIYFLIRYRKLASLMDYIISSMVVLLFIIHPNLCSFIFESFNCIEINGVSYLRYDIQSICYEGTHLFYILTVSLPSLFLWIIGIPLLGLVLMIRNKKVIMLTGIEENKLSDEEKKLVYDIKLKYGFLFNGYKKEHCYWEILIIYRKVGLVMATVYLSNVSPEAQVLLVLMITILESFVQIKYEPFNTKTLNKMELYSLNICSITLYCGMYYITGAHYNYMNRNGLKWFFLLCLAIPNICFLVYWLLYMNYEILKIIFNKSQKLFKIITCGCIDLGKFKEKHIDKAVKPISITENTTKIDDLKQEDLLISTVKNKEIERKSSHPSYDLQLSNDIEIESEAIELDIIQIQIPTVGEEDEGLNKFARAKFNQTQEAQNIDTPTKRKIRNIKRYETKEQLQSTDDNKVNQTDIITNETVLRNKEISQKNQSQINNKSHFSRNTKRIRFGQNSPINTDEINTPTQRNLLEEANYQSQNYLMEENQQIIDRLNKEFAK